MRLFRASLCEAVNSAAVSSSTRDDNKRISRRTAVFFGNRLALPVRYNHQPLRGGSDEHWHSRFEGQDVRKVALGSTFGAALVGEELFFWGTYGTDSAEKRGLAPTTLRVHSVRRARENVPAHSCSSASATCGTPAHSSASSTATITEDNTTPTHSSLSSKASITDDYDHVTFVLHHSRSVAVTPATEQRETPGTHEFATLGGNHAVSSKGSSPASATGDRAARAPGSSPSQNDDPLSGEGTTALPDRRRARPVGDEHANDSDAETCAVRDGARKNEHAALASIIDIQASNQALWALTSEGAVLVWENIPKMVAQRARGVTDSIPRLVEVHNVAQMFIGPHHAVFIDENGELYTVGLNCSGQCGQPTTVPVVYPPLSIESDVGTGWDTAACGLRHTLARRKALFVKGRKVIEEALFSWGDDSSVQLGLGDTRSNLGAEKLYMDPAGAYLEFASATAVKPGDVFINPPAEQESRKGGIARSIQRSTSSMEYSNFEPHMIYTPMPIQRFPLEQERRPHKLDYPPADLCAAGDEFSVFRVRDSPDGWQEPTHKLFCVGENTLGQCGRSGQSSQQAPAAAVKLPRRVMVHDVQCGKNHCLALVQRYCAKEREVYGWGDNSSKQILPKMLNKVCPPQRVECGSKKDPSLLRACAVYCGFDASCIVFDMDDES